MSGQKSEVILVRGLRINVHLPVDMYGGGGGGGGGAGTSIPSTPVSICHEGLLVHYICQDYNHTLRTILGKRRLK